MKIQLSALAALWFPATALAEFVEVPHAQKIVTWNSTMEKIGQDLQLGERELGLAKIAAAAWVFVGPCEGRPDEVDRTSAELAIQIMSLPNASNRFSSAVTQMAMSLITENLGRRPTKETCDFARDIAAPAVRP